MASKVVCASLKQTLVRSASHALHGTLPSTSALQLSTGARRALHTVVDISPTRVIKGKRIHSSARKSQSTATGSIPLVGESSAATTPRPSAQQLQTLFVASAIPMVGFGFMDNFIMIQAGGYIDATLGVTMGLATLTAAAMGQVISDVSGVVFGGTLERFLHRMKMIQAPTLTQAQRHLSLCKNVAMAGSVVGVIIGCMLGASSLLFLDLDANERKKRAAALQDVVAAMLSEGDSDVALNCEGCTVYLASSGDFDHTVHTNGPSLTLQLMRDVKDESLAAQCARTRTVVVDNNADSLLYVPVTKGHDLIAVLEFRNKRHKENSHTSFTENDERIAKIMARHMAIFMDRLSSED